MMQLPVIKNYSYCLIHVPDLVCYGSKPRREIAKDPDVKSKITTSLRTYVKAVCYPPNQTFIGNITPDELRDIPRPWFDIHPDPRQKTDKNRGRFGEILDQETFYALLKLADVLTPPLFETRDSVLAKLQRRLADHHLFHNLAARFEDVFSHSQNPLIEKMKQTAVLPLRSGKDTYGYFSGDIRAEGRDDENLVAHDLLENLCAKASGAVALQWLLHREQMDADQIDFVISCGEEACGDRYQRGGGGMAKAIGEMCGCANASGMDIKNFCAAPASALITACALVQADVYDRIAVVGGGSLAKLGMKFQGFLQHKMEILDDCLASMAFLVTKDDQKSPVVRLDKGAIGKVPISASTSDEAVFRHYFLEPLKSLGLKCTDIDRYALELQNPEIMEFAGSGDVARKNYKKIAAMAVMADQIDKNDMQAWIEKVGMPGFAPTQGHIPSAFPYLGHAIDAMKRKEIKRAMFLSRASLFLNRCTNLLDGVSFILERNPATISQSGDGEQNGQ